MIRVTLTTVLVVLAALPHGICFCHYFSAGPPHEEFACCSLPTPTDSQSTDDQDEDEADCPCKLREIPYFSPAAGGPDRDGSSFMVVTRSMDNHSCATGPSSSRLQALEADHPDRPIPLTLRALLI